jgi:hypothetical protein
VHANPFADGGRVAWRDGLSDVLFEMQQELVTAIGLGLKLLLLREVRRISSSSGAWQLL